MKLMTRTCKAERMNVERIMARGFVLIGGALWVIMAMATQTSQKYSNLVYNDVDIASVVGSALVPLALIVVVFVIGLFYEYLAAAILFGAAAASLAYGLFMGWEAGIWITAGVVLVAPMIIAGLLYFSAARMQKICELEGAVAS